MIVTNFLSSNAYLYLPSKKNPKVILAVDDAKITQNSFQLYNPFSKKGKILKKISRFASLYAHPFMNLFTTQAIQSNFISYLEKKLQSKLVISVYIGTILDKVVLQLQTKEAHVIGYIKYPLNEIGYKHLQNEKKALEVLSQLNIVEPYIFYDKYQSTSFLLLPEIKGTIGIVEKRDVLQILSSLKCDTSYLLSEHPRVISLQKKLKKTQMFDLYTLLNDTIKISTKRYSLVYEHGDFAPWNIIKIENSFQAFDFEYFTEDGLEYLDLCKYYYQIGKLLENKKDEGLIDYVFENISVEEKIIVFKIFLIKEIVESLEENIIRQFEIDLLQRLEER